jgi:aminoglycoside phosphotransferase (APT) family kinase protein
VTEAETERPITSTRDLEALRLRLERWFRGVEGTTVRVSDLAAPEGTGMSSETLLFEVELGGASRRCVARLAPEADAVPVFPTYDLDRQHRVMSLVAERTDVPVPPLLWFEPDPGPLGSACIVMQRIDGLVPPDVLPYTFGDNWLHDADPADRRRLQESTLATLAGIHQIQATPDELAFLEVERPGATALERHVADLRAYYEWVAERTRIPILERCFAWFDEHPLPDDGSATLSWGDARIGNVIYQDFAPVAVLDWEMAALGPPEIDLGWMIYLHRFFQDLAEELGVAGLPELMRPADVIASYEAAGGRPPRDLQPFVLYAALRMGTVLARTEQRRIAFGQVAAPDDPDELVMPRRTLERMLDGSYWEVL